MDLVIPAFPTPPDGVVALIDNHEWVESGLTIEAVNARFNTHHHDFMAVCGGDRVLGICSRSHVHALLGGRYGFALHNRSPVGQYLITGCQIFPMATPLRTILESALSRVDDGFDQDVVITGDDGAYVGMVSTRSLVAAQSALIQDQFGLVEGQRQELEQANASLSRSLIQQRELERRVVQREKAALLETLAGGIAHEINNKLMPIVGYAELLIAEIGRADEAQLRDYCRLLLDGALESSRIIGQLLHLSRPPKTEWEICDMATVIQQSLTLVSLRLKESATKLILDLPSAPALVRADSSQLKQVLMNLVLNAVDAGEGRPSPQVTMRLSVTRDAATISVADRGSGIAPEHLPRIFDPFFTTKAPNRGTGLGLGVCASIIAQHGSEITVDSTLGEGSVFTFVLPLNGDGNARAVRRSLTPRSVSIQQRSVLVIDDDDAVAFVLMQTLRRRLNCTVERAQDGESGRRALLAGDYDTILCDVRMPGMNGLELVAWIREHRGAVLPNVVLMTGDAGTPLKDDIDAAGVAILRKPFTFETLSATLHTRWEAADQGIGPR